MPDHSSNGSAMLFFANEIIVAREGTSLVEFGCAHALTTHAGDSIQTKKAPQKRRRRGRGGKHKQEKNDGGPRHQPFRTPVRAPSR
jgi:hypothetical protein